jgi:U3 small nucleolar RNA-associated protein 15
MPQFQGLKKKVYPKVSDRETAEAKYWKSFATSGEIKLHSQVNEIDFAPVIPDYYLVVSGNQVHLHHTNDDKVQRSFSRFDDTVFSACFRRTDGKLIATGDKKGHIKVFDVTTKSVLRDMNANNSIRCVKWPADGTNIISSSDDYSVQRWDLSVGVSIWNSMKSDSQSQRHGDYVRSIDAHPTDTNIFVSASYDHTVKIWDARQANPVMSIVHQYPVEKCMFTPTGSFIVTAAKNEVNIWNIFGGGSHVHKFSSHQKNISSIAMDASGSKLLSAGLDGHVKIHSMQKLQLTHGMQYYSSISAVKLSDDSLKLVVGFVNGGLISKTRTLKKSEIEGPAIMQRGVSHRKQGQKRMLSTTDDRSVRLATELMESGTVFREKKAYLKPYEKSLRKFQYQETLDKALDTRNPIVVVTVIEELVQRNGLGIAVAGRDEGTLEPLLSFTAKYISNPRYASLITQVAHHILDAYGSIIGHSDSIDELFLKLRRHVKKEVTFQHQANFVMGYLNCIVSNSMNTNMIEGDTDMSRGTSDSQSHDLARLKEGGKA